MDAVPIKAMNDIYFQQDGTSAYNACMVANYLNDRCPNQWLGTNGAIRGPA